MILCAYCVFGSGESFRRSRTEPKRTEIGIKVKICKRICKKTVQPTKSQKNAKKVLTSVEKGDIIIKLSNARDKQRWEPKAKNSDRFSRSSPSERTVESQKQVKVHKSFTKEGLTKAWRCDKIKSVGYSE